MNALKSLAMPNQARASTPEDRKIILERELAALAIAGPTAIDARIDDLYGEWSSGRLTKATAGGGVLVGLILAATVSRWFALLAGASGLLLAGYAFGRQSWLATLYQRLGVRSGIEIHEEILALKALRGDFRRLPTIHDIEDVDAISRLEGEGGLVVDPDEAKVHPRDAVREVVTAARIEMTEQVAK
jgi:hypothetical protein